MKSVLALAAVAALVSAQHFEGQPECAIPCLEKAIPQTSCAMEDQGCQCRPEVQQQLVPLVAGCLVSACTKEGELQQAQSAGAAACAAYAASYSASAPATASSTSSGGPENTPWTYPAMSMSMSMSMPMPMPMPTTTSGAGAVPTLTPNHTSSGAPHSSGTGSTPSHSVVPAAAAGAVIPVLAGGVAAVVAMAANL